MLRENSDKQIFAANRLVDRYIFIFRIIFVL